ncbi:MAG: hypothetical protein JHC31_10245 [Sulfurihydrogenibium sp.]|nr:hypothetical protein [Sulfurihydrogenibium sp.]
MKGIERRIFIVDVKREDLIHLFNDLFDGLYVSDSTTMDYHISVSIRNSREGEVLIFDGYDCSSRWVAIPCTILYLLEDPFVQGKIRVSGDILEKLKNNCTSANIRLEGTETKTYVFCNKVCLNV